MIVLSCSRLEAAASNKCGWSCLGRSRWTPQGRSWTTARVEMNQINEMNRIMVLTSSESSWQLQTDWLKTCLLCILSRNFCNNFFLQKNSPEISKNGLQAHSTIISQSHLHDDSVLYDLVSLQLPDDGVDQLKRRLQRRLPKLNRLLQQRYVDFSLFDFLTHFFETIDY